MKWFDNKFNNAADIPLVARTNLMVWKYLDNAVPVQDDACATRTDDAKKRKKRERKQIVCASAGC